MKWYIFITEAKPDPDNYFWQPDIQQMFKRIWDQKGYHNSKLGGDTKFHNSFVNSCAQFIRPKSKGVPVFPDYHLTKTIRCCFQIAPKLVGNRFATCARDFSCAVSGFFCWPDPKTSGRGSHKNDEMWTMFIEMEIFTIGVLKSRNSRKLLAKMSYASSTVDLFLVVFLADLKRF